MVIDTEKISKELIDDYLETGPIQYLSLTEKDTANKLERLMKNMQYDNVILLASDYYVENLGRMIKKILPAADLAVSNNFRICCGEGLCGSCSIDTSGGDTIKMCKCQLKGEELLDYANSSV